MFKKINIRQFKDERGILSVFEEEILCKRSYWIELTAGKQRGFHAHKTLTQILFCVVGEIKITLRDTNKNKNVVLLRPDDYAIKVGPQVWREFSALEDRSILSVICDALHDEEDYDYDEGKYKIP